jgi:hypothetical protein
LASIKFGIWNMIGSINVVGPALDLQALDLQALDLQRKIIN